MLVFRLYARPLSVKSILQHGWTLGVRNVATGRRHKTNHLLRSSSPGVPAWCLGLLTTREAEIVRDSWRVSVTDHPSGI